MVINKNIRSISYVTIGLILGKLAGFFKHFLIVKYFGLTYDADAFFVANTITEMAINIVLAGLLTGAFVPIASEVFVKHDNKKFSEFINSTFIIIGGFLLLVAILLFIFSFRIAEIIAPGYSLNQHITISQMLRILSPGIVFIGLAAILRGVMHVMEDFLIPSFGLFVANATTIVVTLIFYRRLGIFAPAIGTSLGFFLWFLLQFPFTIKYFKLKSKINLFDNYLKKVFKLLMPSVAIIFFANIILIIEKAVASIFLEGTVSQLNLAFRLANIFSSVLVVPLSTILLPKMAKHFGENKLVKVYELTKRSLKTITLIFFPFLILVIFNNDLLVTFVYKPLNISLESINNISQYLVIYAFAVANLFFYIVLSKVFYSIQKIKNLVIANFLGVILYIITIILFYKTLMIYVLPVAYWVYSATVVIYLFYILKMKIFKMQLLPLNKFMVFWGGIFTAVSLLLKYKLLPHIISNMFLEFAVSLGVIFLYFLIIKQKGSISLGKSK